MSEELLESREGGIVTLTLNRPEKLNALTKDLWRRLGAALRRLDGDDAVRCIVLRGAGGKSFSPGNDISEFATDRSNSEQARVYGALMHETLSALRDCRHPILALIEGICVGGGLEIAASCDLRICGEGSRFGAPIARLGLVMAYPELESVLALAGRAATLQLLLEGRIIGAAEALRLNLVSRVVPDAEVVAESYAAARRIAEGAPLVHRWHKKFIRRLEEGKPLTSAEADEGFLCFDTRDFEIGYRAFLAKQKPEFEGR
ncbi:MAG TPA: enoyl-CoA hydratase-related protein [Stellaceae bacterium]|nr:enoyl-CoA hydratase-related protein [Stellaceae bacterium]